MDWASAAAVFGGAGLGAVLRWRLSLWLAAAYPAFPPGTLAANLLGCLLIGVVAGFFEGRAHIAPELKLLLTTGFLGGFTTFSAFSLEMVTFLAARPLAGMLLIAGKVAACLILTFAGLYAGRAL